MKANRRASLIRRIRDYMPDPDDAVMIAAFELAPLAELQATLGKLRKKTFRAAQLKRSLNERLAVEAEDRKLGNRIKRGVRSALAKVMPRSAVQ